MKPVDIMVRLLGARRAYRLGRGLYMAARGDGARPMDQDGEYWLQSRALEGARRDDPAGPVVCVDVGANVGDWSAGVLERWGERPAKGLRLFSFEPAAGAAEALKKRLAGRESFEHVPMAASSRDGEAVLHLVGEAAGTNSLYDRYDTPSAGEASVRTTTLARFCDERGIKRVHLLKCDAEGHDGEVIRGALPLLKEGRVDAFQFEYNFRWVLGRGYLKDVFDAIAGLPYRLGKLQSDRLDLYAAWHPEMERFFDANYALVHERALGWFATRKRRFDEYNALADAA